MNRITLKFVQGLDSNKEYSYNVPSNLPLSIGRDPSCHVVINDREDVVSRRHVTLEASDPSNQSHLTLVDTSSNGVFVNGAKVTQRQQITDDDKVQLGLNGPVFLLTMEPKPVKATRLVDTATLMKATRLETPSPPAVPSQAATREAVRGAASGTEAKTAEAPMKPAGIGKATLERRIDEATTLVKQEAKKKTVNIVMVGLAALIGVGGYTYYRSKVQDAALENTQRTLEQGANLASDIRSTWGNSTVLIEASWQLVESGTNRVGFHQSFDFGGEKFPMYREMEDGSIRPVITFTPGNGLAVFGGSHTGSGFVVSKDGLIMTNKHVAEAWSVPFDFKFPGIVKRKNGSIDRIDELPAVQKKWVPTRDGYFLEDKEKGGKRFVGRNVTLNVVFPNSNLRVPARNNTPSDLHDVALIKIDVAKPLTPMVLSEDAHNTVKAGHRVVQLGYPGISAKSYLSVRSQEAASDSYNRTSIQDVSVNEGLVSKIVPRISNATVDAFIVTDLGDYIEMNINHSGPGNSGGPLFDNQGKVIGLFTADVANRSGVGSIALAVPIRYGIALLDPTRKVVD